MPRKSAKTREGFVATENKKLRNWTMYYRKIGMLSLDIETIENAGYIIGYDLKCFDTTLVGPSIHTLKNHLSFIIKNLGLHQITKSSKEVFVIYVDKLDKIRGFFKDDITDDSGKAVELMDFIECREWKDWIDEESLEKMQEIVDKVFIPEKYFYLTPNQRTRKRLLKSCDDKSYLEVYPEDFTTYKALRKALFGGLCYVKCPGLIIEHHMICLDIKSAYIFSLLVEKHCMSKAEKISTDFWEYFLDAKDESSFGLYEIKYATASTIVSCYKDISGESFKKGEQVVKVWMNSIDLKLFMDLPKVYVHDVKCLYLEKYKMTYLPDYVRKYLIEEFIKKSEINESKDPTLYALQKTVLNGIYGNTIKHIDCKDDFFALRKTNALAPQWGIWTTSYTKKLLIGLASKLQGWYYSDTDSIYCLYTPENVEIINEYNERISKRVYMDLCKGNDDLFEKLRDLGTFEEKHQIKKFKALKQKEYLFTDFDDKIHVKAAGCNKREMPLDDKLYDMDKLPVGTRVFPKINPEKTEAIINGEKYVSDGSYYEKVNSGSDAEFELWQQAMMNDFFNKDK